MSRLASAADNAPFAAYADEQLLSIAAQYAVDKSVRFRDAAFPSTAASVGALPPSMLGRRVEWRRLGERWPGEAAAVHAERARIFANGEPSSGDAQQGEVEDCWLVSALSVAAAGAGGGVRALISAPDAGAAPALSCGGCAVNIYRDGRWRSVLIDDRVPVDAESGEPLFARQREGGGCWVALIEKAYAKLLGSYAALERGHMSEALVDLTGGAVVDLNLGGLMRRAEHSEEAEVRLWERIRRDASCGALLGCVDAVPVEEEVEAVLLGKERQGLRQNHAYSVLGAVEFLERGSGSGGEEGGLRHHRLLRLRDPWGKEKWSGDWSDGSGCWNAALRASRRVEQQDDGNGVFYMAVCDFCALFNRLYTCHPPPPPASASGSESTLSTVTMHERRVESEWSAEAGTAGGCADHTSHWRNPRWRVRLAPGASLSVMLSQQGDLLTRVEDRPTIGISLYGEKFDARRWLVERTGHWNKREVGLRFVADADDEEERSRVGEELLLVPCTHKAGVDASFALILRSEKPFELQRCD